MLADSRSLVLLLVASAAAPLAAQTKLHSLHGDDPFDELGKSVASAGDVDADGVPDIIVGAPRDHTVASGSGLARVYSGQSGAVLYTFLGQGPSDTFGEFVGGAGDVNADGFDDLIVASRYYDAGDSTGNAQIFSGQDGSVLHTIGVSVESEFLVGSVTGMGDLDGDGFDDVLVAVPANDGPGNNAGSVHVFSGLDASELLAFYGTPFQRFGLVADCAGDVNADGVPDVIIGGGHDTQDLGFAYVFSGADGSELYYLEGEQTFSFFGHAVAGLGDTNGDGHGDFVIGARGHDTSVGSEGMARVYSGMDGSILHTFHGEGSGHQMGLAVAAAGDHDGDGRPDILVGLENDYGTYAGTSAVRIYSGATGLLLDRLLSAIPNDRFGRSFDLAGDLNGDGRLDYLAGAYGGTVNGTNSGSAYILSMQPDAYFYCASTANSTGLAAQLKMEGVGTLTTDDFVLSAENLPIGPGLFLYGFSEQQLPVGNGFLCIGGSPTRMFPILMADASGLVVSPFDTGTGPWAWILSAGDTWKFQYWYRDVAAGGAGFNLSNALSVTFLP